MQQLPPDLTYIEDFISAEEEQALMQEIDAEQWSDKLHRYVMPPLQALAVRCVMSRDSRCVAFVS
jgi:hypothetical protein